MQQPLETHFEWASCFHTANFASVRRQIDDDATFYCIVHHVAHHDKQRKPGFAEVASRKTTARKFTRGKDVFEQLELEMVRAASSRVGGGVAARPPRMGLDVHARAACDLA